MRSRALLFVAALASLWITSGEAGSESSALAPPLANHRLANAATNKDARLLM